MPSQRWNPFRVCSTRDEISSAYAQHGCTCVHILPLAELAQKFVPRMLSVQWNRFLVCSVCDKNVSTYAQHAHAIIFENYSKYQIKMQILTINNRNFGKPSRNPSYRTKVKVLRENLFLIAHQKNLIFFPPMLSHRENVRTSKFWQKSKEKNRNLFRQLTKGI